MSAFECLPAARRSILKSRRSERLLSPIAVAQRPCREGLLGQKRTLTQGLRGSLNPAVSRHSHGHGKRGDEAEEADVSPPRDTVKTQRLFHPIRACPATADDSHTERHKDQ
jgi:hypothetical protein